MRLQLMSSSRACALRVTCSRAVPSPHSLATFPRTLSRVLELVWRDSRMLFRTALQRPLPVVVELVADRMPMAQWFLRYRLDQASLRHYEALAAWEPYKKLFPMAARSLPRQLDHIERRLEASRVSLWPTLRTLLLRPSTHARVVQAARRQVSAYKAMQTSRERVLRTPVRVVLLWVGLLRAINYGLKWVFAETILSSQRRQRWRTRLIERGLVYGVVLMRRLEVIEEAHPWYRPPARQKFVKPPGRALLPRQAWLPAAPQTARTLRPVSSTGIASAARLEGAVLAPPATGRPAKLRQGCYWFVTRVRQTCSRFVHGSLRDLRVLWSTTVL